MAPVRTACHKKSVCRTTVRTCVLFSVLLHMLLFYIPLHQSKVEAMSGSMRMVIVSGSGKPGQSAAAPQAPAGPARPKAVAEAVPQENKSLPESKPEPVVQPQRKPVPVEHRRSVVPPKPKPKAVVRQQPVKQVKKVRTPVEKPRKVVKKIKKARVATKTKRTRLKKIAKSVQKKKAVQTVKNAPSPVAKAVTAAMQQGSQTAKSSGKSANGKSNVNAKTAGGGAPKGPIQARFGSLHGPKITRWMRPKYPRKARDMGRTGLVVLRITIDANGRPIRVEIAKKAGSGFDESAVAAARNSAFAPATHKGRPVTCVALLPVRFNLKGK